MMLSKNGYTAVALLAVAGAIALAILGKPETQFAVLVGLAGTLIGRGK